MDFKKGDTIYCYENDYIKGFGTVKTSYFEEKENYFRIYCNFFESFDMDFDYPFFSYLDKEYNIYDEVWNLGSGDLIRILYGID